MFLAHLLKFKKSNALSNQFLDFRIYSIILCIVQGPCDVVLKNKEVDLTYQSP